MENLEINNDWYIYQNDVYGVNGLLTFQNKTHLMDYVMSEDFVHISAPDGIQEEDYEKIKDLTQKFSTNQLTNIEYAQELLDILVSNQGDIEQMYMEDFESLCKGVSEFSQSCIGGFYSLRGIKSLKEIPEKDKEAFKGYFDNAEDTWIG
jgi:Ni,Fe-hydrogenase I large subunit